MPVELDHFFICTSAGAPGAERLREFGLLEGSRRRWAECQASGFLPSN